LVQWLTIKGSCKYKQTSKKGQELFFHFRGLFFQQILV
jgi:hypothetical protein